MNNDYDTSEYEQYQQIDTNTSDAGTPSFNSAAPEMNSGKKRRKIQMPLGAAIACFLAVALTIALSAVSIKYIADFAKKVETRIAENSSQSIGRSDQTLIPAETAKLPAGENTPSDSLQFASSVVPTDDEYTLIQNSMNAVVSIDVMVQNGYSTVAAGSGSGVIITPDGYIVTCNHVVEGSNKIYVYLNDGTSSEARLIGRDIINDLAVIKIDGVNLTYAMLGDSSTLRIGEGVYAIGNALGELSNTYTEGCISGLDRVIKVEDQEMTLMQTDAAINHGNSGGGLFRQSDGTLIGVVNAKSAGESIEGLGFAIPSTVVKSIVSDLMDYGFVTGRPYLGVSTDDVTLAGYGFFTSYYTYPKITSIEEVSPAASSDLTVGDVILSIDGISVSGSDSLVRTLNSYKIGDTVTITVLRDRQSIDIKITLGERALPNN